MQRFSMPTMVAVLVWLQVLLAKISKKKILTSWELKILTCYCKVCLTRHFSKRFHLCSLSCELNSASKCKLQLVTGCTAWSKSGLQTAGLMYWLCRCIAFCSWAVPPLVCLKVNYQFKGNLQGSLLFLKIIVLRRRQI